MAASAGRLMDEALREAIRIRLLSEFAALLDALGIPGSPTVNIAILSDKETAGLLLMRIRVNGQTCRYSLELLQRVRSYVSGDQPSLLAKPSDILAWLEKVAASESEDRNSAIVEFLTLVCLEAIKLRPAVLLGRAQTAAYCDRLGELIEGEEEATSDLAHFALSRTLNMRISIADTQTVSAVLKEGLAKAKSAEDVAEDLISTLRPRAVEIQIPQDYLRQLTLADMDREYVGFSMMRDGLFYELGLQYPAFRFVPVRHLKPDSFAIKVNHLAALPRLGLQSDQLLVNDTVESLRLLGIEAEPAINPASGAEFCVISSSKQSALDAGEHVIWNRIEFLVLCLSVDLRDQSACFLDKKVVQDMIGKLEPIYPALVKVVKEKFSAEQLTRILRVLLAEEISIRNLRLILERLLDYDYIIADPARLIIFDERLPISREPDANWLDDPANITAFVRAGMKNYIGHKYTKGQTTLMVYLLDPQIEDMIAESHAMNADERELGGIPEDEREIILEAVREEVNSLPAGATTPAILTTIETRSLLREIISAEFSRLPVISYQDLPPYLNIQPVARITLPE